MLRVFSPIPESYLADMLRIDANSNPHPWQIESLTTSLQQFSHLGAFIGTTLVAFVLFRRIVDEAEIIHLVCDSHYQGGGHTTALMQDLCQQLQQAGVSTVFLEVRQDNRAALRVYEKLGFHTIGERPNYYGGKHLALVQKCNLSHQ